MTSTALSGVRIWLSGSVPRNAAPGETQRLKQFARLFAGKAFREGAILVHRFHPSLVEELRESAIEYQQNTGRKAPLRLIVSNWFRDPATGTYAGRTPAEWAEHAELIEVPAGPDRATSLLRLRDNLAAQADSLVAAGGQWWDKAGAGVPAEFKLAITRGISVFLLGSLGGATAGYLKENRWILDQVRNGLDFDANVALASEADIPALVDKVLGQLSLLPLGRRETAGGQPFRILSLDGGGIRGAFTAAVLAHWEESTGRRIADHFDLIAGTSTGGILAIGLGLGLPARELLDFYRNHGKDIFPVTGLFESAWHQLRRVVGAKFGVEALENQLKAAFDKEGVARLEWSRTRLLITSYNMTANALALYRTPHYPGFEQKQSPRAVAVARATSAAPTYFEAAPVDDPLSPHEAVDGGVWANCPALAAVGEVTAVLKVPSDRIELLSVGTAAMAPVIDTPKSEGLSGWALKVADLFMNSQMEATLRYTRQILGNRLLRVDDAKATVQEIDDVSRLDYLIARGVEVATANQVEVVERFLNGTHATPWRERS